MSVLLFTGIGLGALIAVLTSDVIIGVIAGVVVVGVITQLMKLWTGQQGHHPRHL